MESDGVSPVVLPLSLSRPSTVIAEYLRRAILGGEFREANRLPSESRLADQLGVSRHRLREAIRILETEGLIRVRPGRNGGLFPTSPTEEALARVFSCMLASRNVPLSDVITARTLIEPMCAELAARHATKEDIKELWDIVHKAEHDAERGINDLEANSRFHLALARAAHNETLRLSIHSLRLLIGELDAAFSSVETLRAANRAHRAQVHAVEKHDVPGSRDLMRRHLEAIDATVRQFGVDLDARVVGRP